MRIGRIVHQGRPRHARLDGDSARLYGESPFRGGSETDEIVPFTKTTALLSPIEPTKIVAIGRNYRAHAKELGHDVPAEPLLFLKPPSAVLEPAGTIVRPRASERVEHEAELAVVIGKRAHRVSEKDALSYVFGYTALCDVTARDLQKKDVQFTRAKGFDTFAPAGPWIETELDPNDLAVIARVNGVVKQNGRTRDMIFPVAHLIAYVSAVMTLEPGDVISTGTPEGVGPLVAGDTVEVEVEGVGVLRNRVADET